MRCPATVQNGIVLVNPVGTGSGVGSGSGAGGDTTTIGSSTVSGSVGDSGGVSTAGIEAGETVGCSGISGLVVVSLLDSLVGTSAIAKSVSSSSPPPAAAGG